MWFNPRPNVSKLAELKTKFCTLICVKTLSTNDQIKNSNVAPPYMKSNKEGIILFVRNRETKRCRAQIIHSSSSSIRELEILNFQK